MKYAVIAALLVTIGFLADRLAREENQRHALLTGACPRPDTTADGKGAEAWQCLATIQTRPSWLWQVYVGVTESLPPVALTSPD
ncbi:hypothetical protein [Bauldia litoralis]|uniref:Uncharacterized protein n=1 Tax=Bauldia litoralis TaxID=665467 RepID=A0A1G6CF35_9HYPH|nr:hypothetical protein [Bauldia litoralis]SDB31445.1 hypothetical protein SAMN02982931_02405 [Bauldia litoralis]